MKKYLLTTLIFIFLSKNSFCEIKNGYEKGIAQARRSLKSLHELRMNEDLSPRDKRKLKERIQDLVNFITYHEVTGILLRQFKMISPELYIQIDSIKDIKGRSTDVYVKVIPPEEAKILAAGITCIGQADQDISMYNSEYGDGTVSIKIWIFSEALVALSHEFGHVNYLVPNLATYTEFYRANYLNNQTAPNYIGHNLNDMSGKNAITFEKKFRKDYTTYFKWHADRPENLVDLVADFKKRIYQEMTLDYPLATL